jgi:hypothetical protein
MATPGDERTEASVFRWSNPRQQEIYDGLMMIGEGPAAFYRDACQMMAKPSDLNSTTHLVGHLVREIESAIRASLATFARRAEKESKIHNSEKHATEIRAIAQGLGLSDDEPAVQAWLRLADGSYELAPHAVAHREALSRPRPVTGEFERWWIDIEAILQAVLRNFKERFLEPLREVDRLLNVDTPCRNDAALLKNNVPNNAVVLGHFFDRNQNSRWLKPLNEEGIFRYPPSDGRWPQAGYLARMARIDETVADQVSEIISELPDIENWLIRAELVEAVRAMPPSVAARLIDKIEPWSRDATGFLCGDFAALISTFAAGGENVSAFRIAKALLEVTPAPAVDEGEAGLVHTMPRTRPDLWNYEQILSTQVPELVKATGLEAMNLLGDLLSDAIRFSLREPEKSAPSDMSHVWRPAIEEHGQNFSPELRSLLSRAVRDAASAIVQSRQATLEQVIAALEARQPPWRTFRRIALYLLCQIDDPTTARLAAERLTNHDLFDAPECIHEYVGLLQQRFPSLDPGQQYQILGWIDEGPLPEQLDNLRKNFPQFTGTPVTDEDIERFRKSWRRTWLQRLGDHFPAHRTTERDALIAELGPSDHPDLGSYRSEVVGSQSPLGLADFERKSITEQVEYLRDWQPPGDQFMGPSRGGLGEQLAKLVAENPDSYAKEAHRFEEIDPTYQRFLLNGLREAVDKHRSFSWEPVFRLCQRILAEPVEILGRQGGLPLGDDSDRTWCRNAVATLLETALRQKQVPIPIGLKDELWKLLDTLSDDPNPTPEHEARYGGSNMDPAQLALNSTRGQAMHAVIQYAWWVHQSIAKDVGQASSREAPRGFDTVPEARKVLEVHLDTSRDPSLAIRAVYGQRFIWLWMVDKQWATDKADRLFPADESQRSHWEAAWSSYLAFSQPYWDVFEAVRQQYELAVARMNTVPLLPRLPVEPRERLAEHLALLYWGGRIASDGSDPLWERFWSNAPVEVRKHSLWYLGRLIYDAKEPPGEQLIGRLQDLWIKRLAAARAADTSEGCAAEIAQFGWWFCAKKFTDDWAFEQLEAALELSGYVDPDHLVFAALAEAAERKPLESVRCLEKLIAKANGWHFSAYEKDLRQVLVASKDAGGEAAVVVIRVVNALARRGMLKFRDLVE